jgi:type II secretory pathway component GspD/PulD (secretin)
VSKLFACGKTWPSNKHQGKYLKTNNQKPVFVFLLLLLTCVTITTQASGQTVQLPTIQVFGAGSTIVVPDHGSALLGSVSRSSYGTNSLGVPVLSSVPGVNRLFRNQSSGSSVSHSSARVHVQIIDLDELDQAVLAEAKRRREARMGDGLAVGDDAGGDAAGGAATDHHEKAETKQKAAFLSRNIGRSHQ